MKQQKRKSSLFTVGTLLASFFGAAMIAAAFAYFNYKFSEYKFINFNEWVLYSKHDIFIPESESYIVLLYSSKIEPDIEKKLARIEAKYPIIAIDFYQQVYEPKGQVTYLRSDTNTVLKIIQRFNIYEVPSLFIIKRFKETLYKQDSMIHKLKKLDEIKGVI